MSLSSYTFIKKIGQGSYGEVWLVDDNVKKKCVLKKISLSNASEKEKNSARSECQLLKQLIHPNIVQYRDSFEENGTLYIAMAYCEGGDLYSKLKERKGKSLTEKQITEWFIQIVMALSYMHERNILHRDLKTQNIFLAKSSIIKVGDLGIAKQLDSKNSMAMTLIGTPYYMSPELFNKKPYNFKSDIWALGCVTYEMATLKHAFNAKNYNALSYKIIMGQMPSMPSVYNKDLISLIESMLSSKPEKRPSTTKILREPYIQEHIRNFLETAKQTKRGDSPVVSQPIVPRSRADSCGSKSRSGNRSPFKINPEVLPSKLLINNKPMPQRSHHSPVKYGKTEDDDDSDVVCRPVTKFGSKNSHSGEIKDDRRSSQTVLEKQMEKINMVPDIKPPSSASSCEVLIKHSNSSPLLDNMKNKQENNDDVIKSERSSARSRRREKQREQGLKTMLFPSDNNPPSDSKDDDSEKELGDNDSNKRPARERRRNVSENEPVVVLPELKRRTITERCEDAEESPRAEIIHLVEIMNETLSFTNKHKFKAVKDSLLCPVNCYDEIREGPEEDCAETIQRTKMLDKRYPEIRKITPRISSNFLLNENEFNGAVKRELMKSIGWKLLKECYEVLSDMKLDHEVHLKNLLGEDYYEKYAGKVTWLKMVEERM